MKCVCLTLAAGIVVDPLYMNANASALASAVSPAFNIPQNEGSIIDAYRGRTGQMLYLIQDAHTNPSAQLNISRILERITSHADVGHIFMEGGNGDLSLSALRSLASPEKRKKVGLSYLNKGLLQGAEYFNLTQDQIMHLWGVEDMRLYEESIGFYKELKENRSSLLSYLNRIDAALNVLKEKHFNQALKQAGLLRRSYEKGDLGLSEYLNRLFEVEARYISEKSTGLTNLEAIAELNSDEQAIDFKGLNSLLAQERANADTDEVFGLLTLEDNLSPEAMISNLEETVSESAKESSQYKLYRDYLLKASHINFADALRELGELENYIFEGLTRSSGEESLLKADKVIDDLRSLILMRLEPERHRAIKQSNEYTFRFLTGLLNRIIFMDKKNQNKVLLYEEESDHILNSAKDFYTKALERDRSFLKNATDFMTNAGETEAVLIAGGFHTPNLKRLCRQNNISYVVIRPAISHPTDHARYEKILLAQESSFTASASEQSFTISPKPVRMPGGRLSLNEIASELNSQESAQVVEGGRLFVEQEADVNLNENELLSIGVSLGGTKVVVGLLSESGKLLRVTDEYKWSEIYPSGATPEEIERLIMQGIKEVAADVKDIARVVKIGVAFPGPVDEEKGIVGDKFPSPNTPFDNYPLGENIQSQFSDYIRERDRDITYSNSFAVNIYNDSSAAAFGEFNRRSSSASSGIAFILGTGTNGGVVVNEAAYNDGDALKELGFNLVKRSGTNQWEFTGKDTKGDKPVLNPGDSYHIDLFSGEGIVRQFALRQDAAEILLESGLFPGEREVETVLGSVRRRKGIDDDILKEATRAVLEGITHAALRGDEGAAGFIEEIGEDLGRSFAALVRRYPHESWVENIILVGGVGENFARPARGDDLFIQAVRNGINDAFDENPITDDGAQIQREKLSAVLEGVKRSDQNWMREIRAAQITLSDISKLTIVPQVIRKKYDIIDALVGGGSSAGVLLVNDTAGETQVLKYATWSGIGSNGIPWLRTQYKRLSELHKALSRPDWSPVPEVYDYYEEENLVYYTLEYYKTGRPLSLYHIEAPNPSAQGFLEDVNTMLDVLTESFYSQGKLPLPDGYVQKVHFDRLQYRLDLLREERGEVFKRLLEGGVYPLQGGRKVPLVNLFKQVMGQTEITINGKKYINPERILHQIRSNPVMLKAISPSYLPEFGHGDALLRNFMRMPDGEIKVFDVRGVDAMPNSPSRVDIPYEVGKLLHGIELELVRSDYSNLEVREYSGGTLDFELNYDVDDPRVKAFLETRGGMPDLIWSHSGMNEILKDEPNWLAKSLFAEATHFLADAPNRLENDRSGRHAIAYYLIGTILLNDYYETYLRKYEEDGGRLTVLQNVQAVPDMSQENAGARLILSNQEALGVRGSDADKEFLLDGGPAFYLTADEIMNYHQEEIAVFLYGLYQDDKNAFKNGASLVIGRSEFGLRLEEKENGIRYVSLVGFEGAEHQLEFPLADAEAIALSYRNNEKQRQEKYIKGSAAAYMLIQRQAAEEYRQYLSRFDASGVKRKIAKGIAIKSAVFDFGMSADSLEAQLRLMITALKSVHQTAPEAVFYLDEGFLDKKDFIDHLIDESGSAGFIIFGEPKEKVVATLDALSQEVDGGIRIDLDPVNEGEVPFYFSAAVYQALKGLNAFISEDTGLLDFELYDTEEIDLMRIRHNALSGGEVEDNLNYVRLLRSNSGLSLNLRRAHMWNITKPIPVNYLVRAVRRTIQLSGQSA